LKTVLSDILVVWDEWFFLEGSNFYSYLLAEGEEFRKVVCQKSTLSLVQDKQNLRAACPDGKLEFKFFSSPEYASKVQISH